MLASLPRNPDLFSSFLALFKKDFSIEWRNRYILSGALLYSFSSIFVSYLSFESSLAPFNQATWLSLYFVILLFAATGFVSRSFQKEEGRSKLFFFQLVSPVELILSKILYNTFILSFLSLLSWSLFVLFFGSPINSNSLFLMVLFLSSTSLGTSLTLISGIASKTSNQATLMVVLGFPIVIPQILLFIKISEYCFLVNGWTEALGSILLLLAIDAILLSMSYLLFPYLWRS